MLFCDPVGDLGGKGDDFVEMGCNLRKEIDPGDRVQFIPSEEGLEGDFGFMGRGPLPQTGHEMGMTSEGVIFVGQELFKVRPGDLGLPDDNRIGGKVAQTLGLWAEEAGEATDQVAHRKADVSIGRVR